MQITVDIPDDLAPRVQASGLTPELYVRSLIENAVRSEDPALKASEPKMSMREFIRAMSEGSEKIPQLPDQAFTRETFNQDHD